MHYAYGIPALRVWLGKLIDPSYDVDEANAFKQVKFETDTKWLSLSQPPLPHPSRHLHLLLRILQYLPVLPTVPRRFLISIRLSPKGS